MTNGDLYFEQHFCLTCYLFVCFAMILCHNCILDSHWSLWWDREGKNMVYILPPDHYHLLLTQGVSQELQQLVAACLAVSAWWPAGPGGWSVPAGCQGSASGGGGGGGGQGQIQPYGVKNYVIPLKQEFYQDDFSYLWYFSSQTHPNKYESFDVLGPRHIPRTYYWKTESSWPFYNHRYM